MRKTTFIFICTVCFTSILWAQNPIHWNVSLGGSFPIGNYGIMSYVSSGYYNCRMVQSHSETRCNSKARLWKGV